MSNSKSIQDNPDPKLSALIVRALAPADIQGASKSELEAVLDAESPELFADDQLEFLFEKLNVLLREESKKLPQTIADSDDVPSPPLSPILGFLGNLSDGLGSISLFTPTLWALLILVSGVVFTGVIVAVVAVRGIHVHIDNDREVAKQSLPVSPVPSSVAPLLPDLTLRTFPASPIDLQERAGSMLDPATDRADEQWCYLAKSTTVIGMPYQPDVTQITYDGAVFTKNAELRFFYGPDDRPLLARGKRFLEGWIPVVQYSWREGDIAYEIEYFAAPLEGAGVDNTVNFVRVRMKNAGSRPQPGRFVAALRHNGGDYRYGGSGFSPDWKYAMSDTAARRDGKLAYCFSPGAQREAVPGVGYNAAFVGAQYGIGERSECCLARYQRELQPGESFVASFKMPRVPTADAGYLAKLEKADYATCRAATVAWWQNLLASGARFSFPEKCVEDAMRASLVHVLLATRVDQGRQMQTDGLPYPIFCPTGSVEEGLLYLVTGHANFSCEGVVGNALQRQMASGLYEDFWNEKAFPCPPAGHGQILSIATMTALFTRDKTLGEHIFPSIAKGVAYIDASTRTDPYGLMPPTYPYDNEMIDGHYASNNYWALLGLRGAVRLARFLERDKEADAWMKLEQRFEANILKGISASVKPDGYVPPGLYSYLTGKEARRGFQEYETHCDWENMLLSYPAEVLSPQDPRVRGTVEHVRKGYAEGIMTYRHGMHLHQYITANQIEQYLAMGDSYMALKDFYHVLLHAGSTYEGFENLVRPWTDRHVDPGCPSPHAWASAKLGTLIRDLVLLEYGGKNGLEPQQRELWLFHCLSPAWTRPGDVISFSDAPTEFGPVTAEMKCGQDDATLTIAAKFHSPPARFRVRIPYFKTLTSYETDAKLHSVEGDCLLVSPDATRIVLRWHDKPAAHEGTLADLLREYRKANSFEGIDGEGRAIVEEHAPFLLDGEKGSAPQPLSFAVVRDAFQHEYALRAARCVGQVRVEAPAMEHPPVANSLAGHVTLAGARAWATSNEPGHGPEKAIDGSLSLESSWRATPFPQTLNIELSKPLNLCGLHIWPYWGKDRFYRYYVDISADGKNWTTVGDRSHNSTPATAAGEQFFFTATRVGSIRVRMLYDSLNPGVHIVEVMGIEAPSEVRSAATIQPRPGDADYPQPSPSSRHEAKVKAVKEGNYDLVLIGDSIVHTLQDFGGNYDAMNAVWAKHFAPRHAINLGHNGYRTENIIWNLQNGELDFAKSPKLFVLLIGTNNADDRHFPRVHTAEEIFAGTKAIVDVIRKRHPTSKVLVLRIFPRGGDAEKSAVSWSFNSSAKCIETCHRAGELTAQLADGEHVFWLDVNHVFLRSDGSINTDRLWDLLHPSPAGAEVWVRAIEPTLAKLLGEHEG